MEITVELDSNIIFLKMNGSLVADSLEKLKNQVQKLVEKKYIYIVFDMSRINFIDSSGLGFCISISKELTAKSGKLVCCGLQDNVRKLFAMTRADQKITVMENRTSAFDLLLAELNDELPSAATI